MVTYLLKNVVYQGDKSMKHLSVNVRVEYWRWFTGLPITVQCDQIRNWLCDETHDQEVLSLNPCNGYYLIWIIFHISFEL